MIKFFRKIRQNLLNEGKSTKYLKYTIQKQQKNCLSQIKGEMISNLKSLAIEKEELVEKLDNAYKIY